ncbi:excinuclease ABC subunit C [Haploplasma axanthum]|uniref:UvrABC system protein C n=2 Tax=Haploplasma axanthum TaxID=29552 RepID=A0A449BFD2_HAPAX|nr:excinuclease ABC subunit UvrC [Haploplasma axanthum]VEU81146.1 excinuclease ABC subunit C [Haploplasma axanthum]
MNLKEKLKLLPDNPGCYLMKNDQGQVIYVGKAKNLKNRVKSYFMGSHNTKTTKLVSEIRDFDLVITNSEQESLILELNLIKEYRPKYNIVFMDDKTYPYIEITNTVPPEIRVVRTKKTKGKLFGPYPNVISARETARLLQLIFPMGRIETIPNFYEEIGSDIVTDISNNYNKQVAKITRFLKGDTKEIIDALTKAMIKYSENMMFERAAVIRDKIEHIKNTTEKQIISLNDYKDRDIIGVAYNDEDIAIQILFMRNGKITDQHQVVFSYVGDAKEFSINYLVQFYEDFLPDELLFDMKMFKEEELVDLKNIFIPQKGDKRKIVELASKNARMDLENYQMLYRNKFEKTNQALDKLKELLEIKKVDLIEVFDNSQLFGTAPISAMIVYENGKFNKKLYRKYHLKTTQNDDYAAMREVIYRRYQKVLIEGLNKPDLVLVDGGKGHLKIAKEVLDSLNLDIKVAGLRKNDKHQLEAIVLSDKEVLLKDHRDVYQLLFKISEEVHRYAITFHRQTRKKKFKESPLDKVVGLGPVRKQKLLKSFNSIKDMANASDERFISLKIPKEVIKSIRDVLKDEINN